MPVLLAENASADTLIARERDICWREGRLDIVVVNGALSGFEIKSGRDSLARLPRQAELYSRVLDFATLVCDDRHVDAAVEVVPEWWGLRRAVRVDGLLQIEPMRAPLANKSVRAHDLAKLLFHDELYAELAGVRKLRRISRLRQADMAWLLAEVTDLDELRGIVRCRLRQRPSWLAAAVRT